MVEYKKLEGFGGSFLNRLRPYLLDGGDHLLSVDVRQYSEYYKRFYYKDIQAVIVVNNSKYQIANLLIFVAMIILFTFLMSFLTTGAAEAIAFVVVILAIPVLIALAVNLTQGATCDFYIKTAVQTEKVPAIKRLKKVDWALALLEPRILEAQKGLSQPVQEAETPANMEAIGMEAMGNEPVGRSPLLDEGAVSSQEEGPEPTGAPPSEPAANEEPR